METYRKTRKHGTQETIAGNPQDRINAIRKIVTEGQYAKVDGTMIDGYSASAILKVYDNLNDENKARFASLPAGKMGEVAWKVLK